MDSPSALISLKSQHGQYRNADGSWMPSRMPQVAGKFKLAKWKERCTRAVLTMLTDQWPQWFVHHHMAAIVYQFSIEHCAPTTMTTISSTAHLKPLYLPTKKPDNDSNNCNKLISNCTLYQEPRQWQQLHQAHLRPASLTRSPIRYLEWCSSPSRISCRAHLKPASLTRSLIRYLEWCSSPSRISFVFMFLYMWLC